MISQETIRHVAHLARLELSDKEVELYSKQLTAILDNFEQLQKLDMTDVPPLVTASDMPPTFRDDELKQSLGPDGTLANSPERSGNLYKVPAVL